MVEQYVRYLNTYMHFEKLDFHAEIQMEYLLIAVYRWNKANTVYLVYLHNDNTTDVQLRPETWAFDVHSFCI